MWRGGEVRERKNADAPKKGTVEGYREHRKRTKILSPGVGKNGWGAREDERGGRKSPSRGGLVGAPRPGKIILTE